MVATILSMEFRGTRRIRLFFSGALATGAFTSTSLYGVSSDIGPSPTSVTAAFAISSTPNGVEIAIDSDIATSAIYSVACTAVPLADTTTCTGTIQGNPAQPTMAPANSEPETGDIDLLLYGRDLLHNGMDFVEDASGDLATITGRLNWKGAIGRRMASYGLRWDPRYSPRADLYVNAPDAYKLPLAGSLLAQAQADDRTKSATCAIVQAPSDPNSYMFQLSIVGKDKLATQTVLVPVPS